MKTVVKCGVGCYVDATPVKCAKCRKQIKANEPRHSYLDFDAIQLKSFHCRCKPRH
jgi:hypothetical protein